MRATISHSSGNKLRSKLPILRELGAILRPDRVFGVNLGKLDGLLTCETPAVLRLFEGVETVVGILRCD